MSYPELEQQACDLLARYIDNIELEPDGHDFLFDVLGRTKEVSLAIEIHATKRRGVDDIKGRLATAVLQMPHYAAADDYLVVLVHAPRIGSRAINRLEEFMAEYAPEFGWGVWDDRGAVYLRLPQLGVSVSEVGGNVPDDGRQTTHNKRAFTDLNRWLLKVLMLRDAPHGMWHDQALYRQEVANPAELGRVAYVSQAKAYQFARTFRDLGLLRWDRSNFRVPERRRLFELWYEEERQIRVERHPVRPIFMAGAGVAEVFAGEGADIDYAVGGFEACRLHGVLHTQQRKPEIHVFQSLNYVLQHRDLESCSESEAEMYLIETPYRESVQRAALQVGDVRVVDILQAALDAGRHAQRGREQAEYIIGEVLGW
jgi:hypothetical protein